MRRRDKAGRRREPPRSISEAARAAGAPGGRRWRPSLLGILLRAARDVWGESFFLMAFNFIFAVSAVPGMLLLWYALDSRQIGLVGIGVAALSAWPFTTFGLFYAAGQAVAREPIHLRTFFEGGRRRLGLAYRWGALNLVVVAVLAVNASFYLDPQAPLFGTWLASFLGAFFLLACLAWAGGQACLLGVVAALDLVSLRVAWRELRPVILRRPAIVFATGTLCAALFLTAIVVLPLGLLLGFVCAAVLACRMAIDLTDERPSAVPQFSRGAGRRP